MWGVVLYTIRKKNLKKKWILMVYSAKLWENACETEGSPKATRLRKHSHVWGTMRACNGRDWRTREAFGMRMRKWCSASTLFVERGQIEDIVRACKWRKIKCEHTCNISRTPQIKLFAGRFVCEGTVDDLMMFRRGSATKQHRRMRSWSECLFVVTVLEWLCRSCCSCVSSYEYLKKNQEFTHESKHQGSPRTNRICWKGSVRV